MKIRTLILVLYIVALGHQTFAASEFRNADKDILNEVLLSYINGLKGCRFTNREKIQEGHETIGFDSRRIYTNYYSGSFDRTLDFDQQIGSGGQNFGPLKGWIEKTGTEEVQVDTYTIENHNVHMQIAFAAYPRINEERSHGLWSGEIHFESVHDSAIYEGSVNFSATGGITLAFDDGKNLFYQRSFCKPGK